jgi:hypothetical protein
LADPTAQTRTQITISKAPDFLAACNCTFCSKVGALWAYFGVDKVSLEKVNDTFVYSPGPNNEHHFCRHCGCMSYTHQKQSYIGDGTPGGPKIAVNARLLEDFDVNAIPVEKLDGLNQW